MQSNCSVYQRGRGRQKRHTRQSTIYNVPIIHLNQKFILVGGYNGSTRFSRIAAYDPSTNEWNNGARLLTPRNNAGVIPIADTSFIIMK